MPAMSRQRQPSATTSPSIQHPSKRLKTTKTSHVPAPTTGLGFLVDEDARAARKLQGKLTNGVPSTRTTRVDESRAVMAPGAVNEADYEGSSPENAIGISSEEEESSDDDEEDEEGEDARKESAATALSNGHLADGNEEHDGNAAASTSPIAALGAQEDVRMADPPAGDEQEDDPPTFGDMLQTLHPEAIDITSYSHPASIPHSSLNPVYNNTALATTTGTTTLTTVLTQALRTTDTALLETCLTTTDVPTIRATIQRLPSAYVGTLLQRLSERIHRRPGRAGHLLVWVQWALVAHGAYIATQPGVMGELRGLKRVLRERASGLQPLLVLKGKLDLLAAQMELRRGMVVREDGGDGEAGEGVVYVEGQEEDDGWDASGDDEEALVEDGREVRSLGKKVQMDTPRSEQSDVGESDGEEEGGMPNGVVQEDSSDAEEDDDDEEGEGLLDVEAEETSNDEEDSAEEEEADSESDPSSEEEQDSDAESDVSDSVQPAHPKTLNRKR